MARRTRSTATPGVDQTTPDGEGNRNAGGSDCDVGGGYGEGQAAAKEEEVKVAWPQPAMQPRWWQQRQ